MTAVAFFVNTAKARHTGGRGNKRRYGNLELVFRDHCPLSSGLLDVQDPPENASLEIQELVMDREAWQSIGLQRVGHN